MMEQRQLEEKDEVKLQSSESMDWTSSEAELEERVSRYDLSQPTLTTTFTFLLL